MAKHESWLAPTGTDPRVHYLDMADGALCLARRLLQQAHAPKTLARVRLAISSLKGARRNAKARAYRKGRG